MVYLVSSSIDVLWEKGIMTRSMCKQMTKYH